MFATLRKMWAQVGGALATLVYGLISDSVMTPAEWAVLATEAGAILLVYYVKNTGDAWYAKAVAAFWTAASVIFMTAIPGGVDGAEWGHIIIAGLTAVVVLAVPNAGALRAQPITSASP